MVTLPTGEFYVSVVSGACTDLYHGQLDAIANTTISGNALFWPSSNCASASANEAFTGAYAQQNVALSTPQGALDFAPVTTGGSLVGAWITPSGAQAHVDTSLGLTAQLTSTCALYGDFNPELTAQPGGDQISLDTIFVGCDTSVGPDLAPFLPRTQGLSTATVTGVFFTPSFDNAPVGACSYMYLWLTITFTDGSVELAYLTGTSATPVVDAPGQPPSGMCAAAPVPSNY
jgi:hypothetical protein